MPASISEPKETRSGYGYRLGMRVWDLETSELFGPPVRHQGMKLLLALLPVLAFAACSACDGAMNTSPATEEFSLKYASAESVAQTLMAEEAGRGNTFPIRADTRANSVFVGPTLRSALIRIKGRIRELDVR